MFWCFGTACVVLGLCSTCSPLYPIHIWDDSNCFFTVGKSLWTGKLPYRDLYEQKGALLYLLHSFAALISYRSFFGIFLVEVVATTAFLWYSVRTIQLFSRRNILPLVPFLAACVYSSFNFVLGDSVEEFALPMLTYVIFVTMKHTKEQSMYRPKELVVIGMMAGAIFWSKFSIVGFFVGWAIGPVVQYARQRKLQDIFKSLFWVLEGLTIVTIPILVLYLVMGGISDLLKVYFYTNLVLYPQHVTLIERMGTLVRILATTYWYNYAMAILQILSLFVWGKLGKLFWGQFACMYIFTAATIFWGGFGYAYYSFVLWTFAPLGLIPLFSIIPRHLDARASWYSLCLGLSLLITGFVSDSTRLIGVPVQQYPQYTFSTYIKQKPNATVMCYGCLDQGIFTVGGLVPSTKYFCTIHMDADVEQKTTQLDALEKGLVDFVITAKAMDIPGYRLVLKQEEPLWRKRHPTLFLYERDGI